jgi:phosphoribosylglycinamide formyltransferase-1
VARLAVFASGRGSNFRAIHHYLGASAHELALLVTDRSSCGAADYARAQDIPVYHASYRGRSREAVEEELLQVLRERRIDVIALAGFIRILTPLLVAAFRNRILNIHPSLLPKHPGMDAIRRSYDAGDELGITIHLVDEGVDTGPILEQHTVHPEATASLEQAAAAIREAEHHHYPRAVARLLNRVARTDPETGVDPGAAPGSWAANGWAADDKERGSVT